MNISTLTKKTHIHTQKYMNYYNFFVLIKRKRKNRIIKNIVKTENVERRIIKWERVWMIIEKRKMEREREREREKIFATTASQTKKSKIITTVKPKRA